MPHPDNSFGLVRLLLALIVLWGHAWYIAGCADMEPLSRWLLGGAQPIAVFAMQALLALSGYLVAQSAQRAGSARQFLWQRLLRIFPALWACLAFTAFVLPLVVWSARPAPADGWSDALGYFWRNLVFMRTQIGIEGFAPGDASPRDLNGSLWMLEYQVGCYTVLAALVWLGATSRARLATLIGLAVLLLYVHDWARPTQAVFFNTRGRRLAAWFICGALAAQLPESFTRRVLTPAVTLGALAAYAAAARCGGLPLLGPVLSAILVLGTGWSLGCPGLEQQVRGDYSYGVYLYGYPIQQTLAATGALTLGLAAYIGLTTLATFGLAVLSRRFIETPALAFKDLSRLRDANLRRPSHA